MVKKRIQRTLRISKYVIYKETLVDYKENVLSFIGAFLGIGIIAFWQSHLLPQTEMVFLIGSFGASSVLIYGAVQSPLAQPRNLIGGHVISAFVGVTVYKFFPDVIWLTAPFAVAASIVFMQVTKTLHPPGGATALLAVIGTEKIKALGYLYVITPVFSGAVILFIVALLFNNMSRDRKYPTNSRFTRYFKMKVFRSLARKTNQSV